MFHRQKKKTLKKKRKKYNEYPQELGEVKMGRYGAENGPVSCENGAPPILGPPGPQNFKILGPRGPKII